MGQVTKMVVEPVPAACGAHTLHWAAGDFRTLRRYFLEFVLPVLTLAAMSALTVVLLVLIVSAVADMELYSQSHQASPDPWSADGAGSTMVSDRQAYPDEPARMQMPDADDPSLGPQTRDQIDAPWARWTPE
jgi:hypothetical protein